MIIDGKEEHISVGIFRNQPLDLFPRLILAVFSCCCLLILLLLLDSNLAPPLPAFSKSFNVNCFMTSWSPRQGLDRVSKRLRNMNMGWRKGCLISWSSLHMLYCSYSRQSCRNYQKDQQVIINFLVSQSLQRENYTEFPVLLTVKTHQICRIWWILQSFVSLKTFS